MAAAAPRRSKSFSPPKSILFVGPYCITKRIGEGSFSAVYLATHVVNGDQVAVKVLHKPTLSRSETALRFATREYCVLERVRGHPYIINLSKRYETEEYTCLVMEYLPCGDLLRAVQQAMVQPKRAFQWFYQLMGALEHCHRNGICHRDIKLENVLLDENDTVRLCDFGMANFKSSDAMLFATYCGSPHYVAPEIVRGEKYDAVKSDVWSLGVVLYALYSRKLPFMDTDTTQVLQKVLRGKFTIPSGPGGFSEHLASLVQHMLHTDPAKRITLAQIKKTKFWREGCMQYGLNAEGVSSVIPPQPPSAAASPMAGHSSIVATTASGSAYPSLAQSPGGLSEASTPPGSAFSPGGSNWGGFDALSAVCSSIEEHTLLRVDPRQIKDTAALQELVTGLQQLCRALAMPGPSAADKTRKAVAPTNSGTTANGTTGGGASSRHASNGAPNGVHSPKVATNNANNAHSPAALTAVSGGHGGHHGEGSGHAPVSPRTAPQPRGSEYIASPPPRAVASPDRPKSVQLREPVTASTPTAAGGMVHAIANTMRKVRSADKMDKMDKMDERYANEPHTPQPRRAAPAPHSFPAEYIHELEVMSQKTPRGRSKSDGTKEPNEATLPQASTSQPVQSETYQNGSIGVDNNNHHAKTTPAVVQQQHPIVGPGVGIIPPATHGGFAKHSVVIDSVSGTMNVNGVTAVMVPVPVPVPVAIPVSLSLPNAQGKGALAMVHVADAKTSALGKGTTNRVHSMRTMPTNHNSDHTPTSAEADEGRRQNPANKWLGSWLGKFKKEKH